MGSSSFEYLEAIGIKRGGGSEPCHGPPEAFTIIGLDISADDLAALYPETKGKPGEAHERARALIKGVRDRTRTAKPPPDAFVQTVGSAGVMQRIIIADLGRDKNGKPWAIIVVGRQRDWAVRLWNEANPGDEREVIAELRGFPNKAGIDAELTALETNAVSNVFVAMSPSQMASHATMLRDKNISDANIAIRVGAKDADHVRLLLELAECAPEVQDAVDAMKIPMALVSSLKSLSPEEQARRMARKNAGTSKKSKDDAAPPRPKARPVALVAQAADEAEALGLAPDLIAFMRWSAGDNEALKKHPALTRAIESAEELLKANKSKPGKKSGAVPDPDEV